MPVKRVALIFDNSARPETTGLYCRRALGNLVEIDHFLPSEISQIPAGAYDLFLNVDDGLNYSLPRELRPAALWAIDTHIEFERTLNKATDFDFVFAAQKDGTERLQTAGIDSAVWLPLACDSEIHRPHPMEKTYDVGFVGNLFPGPRSDLLEQIQKSFPRTFIGQRYFEEMAIIYSASKIVFNRSILNDVNMRVFEALACGSLLVTNDLKANGQEELFGSGQALVTYVDPDDLLETIDFYLQQNEKRERIAQAGREEALARHTYLHRMVQLLEHVEVNLSTTRVTIPEWNPVRQRPVSAAPIRPDHPRASACLVSWKRPENVKKIVEQLQQEPLIDDIVVWNNNPDLKLDIEAEKVTVINSEQNLVTYGRFLATQHARHNLIYTQDDDCLVHNINELYASFERDRSCLSHALKLGHLTNNSENFFYVPQPEAARPGADHDPPSPDHRSGLPQAPVSLSGVHMALVGWGAFFEKKWCRVFEKYIVSYGEDALLHRKADRIFGLLLNRRHRSLPAEVTDLDGASGSEALSVKQDHFELTNQAIERSLSILSREGESNLMGTTDIPHQATPQSSLPMGDSAAGAKDQSYFEFARPELLEMVSEHAERVLDVGCGAGKLGESIKQRQSAEVWGIERDPGAATLARERLDRVLTGAAEETADEIGEIKFDCIICGDVLEHMRDPDQFLQQARSWLSDEGRIIASIPNVRHHTVVGSLLIGNWTYESAGLLDQDHVRFFTRREIEKLFYRAGFQIDALRIVPGPGYQEWAEKGRRGEVKAGRLNIGGLTSQEAEEFYVYQYLIEAVPDRKAIPQLGNQEPRIAEVEDKNCKQLEKLKSDFFWLERKPTVPLPTEDLGWLADGSRAMLSRELNEKTQLVLELGTWLGLSTRFIADEAKQATVITVDHWEGSPEHHKDPKWQARLPQLYETFQALNWEYRERFVPLKMTTLEGLQTVANYDLQPDLIFLDAEHSYEAVTAELELCRRLFPYATLVGDDFDDPGVGKAVQDFANQHKFDLQTAGTNWRAWKLTARQPSQRLPYPADRFDLTSIVLVTHNQLPYTKMCLDSIRQFTDEAYELVVVDNGSTDGTPEYLQSLEDVTMISNPDNRGFPAAVNQGIQAANGKQILLLNNDTIVTTGWLRRMLDALESDDTIGLVGPYSNKISGYQQIPVDYQDLSELDGFAWKLGQQHKEQRANVERLIGFCLLIKKEVIDTIGLFDEQFGIGNYEDDDFCRRAGEAGYRLVIAQDAFIHHFGSTTFRASGVDFHALMQENQQKYAEKWNAPPDEKYVSATPTSLPIPTKAPRPQWKLEATSSGALLLEPNDIKLSLCMIVRNNEETIEPCLKSIQPWVDEIVVVDTGSIDKTPKICQQYGARLFHFPWCDDFSAARNVSFQHARGEWLFWMDSDDTITEECGRKLRALANGAHAPNTLGYTMQVHCPAPASAGGCLRPQDSDTENGDVTVVDHVKLVRNRPDICFEHRIHEQLLPAIRRAGGEVAWTDLYVIHSGSDHSPEGRKRKLERDYRILELDLQERPDHPFVLFNLGMTYADDEQYDQAIQYLKRCIEVSNPQESHLRKAYALLVSAYSQSDRHYEGWVASHQGLRLYPDDKELLFRFAMLQHHFGRLPEAEATYLKVLNEETERHFTSVDVGINGYKARHNLAIVYDDMGKLAESEKQWRQVVKEQPGYIPGYRGLGECLLKQQKHTEIEQLATEFMKKPLLKAIVLELKAKTTHQTGSAEEARKLLKAAIQAASEDPQPRHTLAQWLFEANELAEAIPVLEELAELSPDDPSVFHNLGSAYLQEKRYSKAASALKRSLELRPQSTETQNLFSFALRRTTSPEEAVLVPGNSY